MSRSALRSFVRSLYAVSCFRSSSRCSCLSETNLGREWEREEDWTANLWCFVIGESTMEVQGGTANYFEKKGVAHFLLSALLESIVWILRWYNMYYMYICVLIARYTLWRQGTSWKTKKKKKTRIDKRNKYK